MNKLFLYSIIVAALCAACATNENAAGGADKNAAEVKLAVNDKVECAKLSDIKMDGFFDEFGFAAAVVLPVLFFYGLQRIRVCP